eukprot:g29444.t1
MSKFYQAELAAIDFAERSEEARVHINAWVEGQTEGKMSIYYIESLKLMIVSMEVVMSLEDAVKGSWGLYSGTSALQLRQGTTAVAPVHCHVGHRARQDRLSLREGDCDPSTVSEAQLGVLSQLTLQLRVTIFHLLEYDLLLL